MMEQAGQVVRIDGGLAVVQVVPQSACGSCSASKGCGTSAVAKLFPKRLPQVAVRNDLGVQAGDDVVIGLADNEVQAASLTLYGVPLAGLLAGAIAGQQWGGSEPWAILGGLSGMLAGLALARQLGVSRQNRPVLLRRLPRSHGSVPVAAFTRD